MTTTLTSSPAVSPVIGLEAAIFDMDGLLVESESRWRIAEHEMCRELGLPLGDHDFDATMGLRMREVTQRWFAAHPWQGPSTDEVADRVIDRVIELCADAVALSGVSHAIELCRAAGLRVGLCSSSDQRMIDAVLGAIELTDAFEVVHSAENDTNGKPHPEPYLVTAAALGVPPGACVVFEDSVAGCLSGASAGMAVIAVPAEADRGSTRFGFADLVLSSLEAVTRDDLVAIGSRTPQPSMARPRFHLAIPVDDLETARAFYLGVLGCTEGRSSADWVDFDLWGHQVVAHLVASAADPEAGMTNLVDGKRVPVRHFGLVVDLGTWRQLVARLEADDTDFVIEPGVRFAGEPGEQHTCFLLDPAGNALEFKAFRDDRQVFAP